MKFTFPPIQRKYWIGAGAGFLVVIIAVVTGILIHLRNQPGTNSVTCLNCSNTVATTQPTATPTATPTPTPIPLVARKLDGVLVPTGTEDIRPLAVMIENHPDARPQSGLSKANLVYEAIAEGGITRFMAVFANPQTSVRVGPVRSARTYFLDFATELNAFYAHVGGNIDALDQISQKGGVGNLDEFSVGSPTYARDPSRNVAIEHTMYSTTDALWQYAMKKGMSPTSQYTGWSFTDPAPTADRGSAQSAHIVFSSASYTVDWKYNLATNLYERSLAGSPHLDAIDTTQITASNIVLQTVVTTHITTRIGEDGWRFTLTGSGKGTLLQNGIATPITWKKSGTDRTIYTTADGKEVQFVRGTTWVELVHSSTGITIK